MTDIEKGIKRIKSHIEQLEADKKAVLEQIIKPIEQEIERNKVKLEKIMNTPLDI